MFSKTAKAGFPDLAASAAAAKAGTKKERQAEAGLAKIQRFFNDALSGKVPAVGGASSSGSGSAGPPAVGGSTVSKSKQI
eukprot:1996829-Alexandrium_andersonii.AAC.1